MRDLLIRLDRLLLKL